MDFIATSRQAASLWPGLLAAWRHGCPRGLALAVLYAVLLNAAILSTFYWPAMAPAMLVRLLWAALVLSCIYSFWKHWWDSSGCRKISRKQRERIDTLFNCAQAEYLQGNYSQCQTHLHDILRRYPRDAESRLLMVTALRRQNNSQLAFEHLNLLSRSDGAAPWRDEIETEYRLLKKLRHQSPESESDHQEVQLADGQASSANLTVNSGEIDGDRQSSSPVAAKRAA